MYSNWLALAKGDKTAPFSLSLSLITNFSFLNLEKASSLNLRYLNFNNVYLECLKYKLDPALVYILYSGLIKLIWNGSLLIISDLSHYSITSRRKLLCP